LHDLEEKEKATTNIFETLFISFDRTTNEKKKSMNERKNRRNKRISRNNG
jgi:hypothetical protein